MAESEILDQLTKNAPWLVIPATLLTAAPKLIELWQGFAGTHDGRRQLEIEKARLENLKLRVEIEALKKQHNIDLPEADIPVSPVPASLQRSRPSSAIQSAPPEKKIWGWLRSPAKKWPGMTVSAAGGMALASVWLGLISVFAFLVGAVAEWSTEPKEVFWYILGGCFLFLLPGLALLKFGSSLKVQSKLLKTGMNPPSPPAAASTM